MGLASCEEDTYCFWARLHQLFKNYERFSDFFYRLHSSGINTVQTRGILLFWKDPEAKMFEVSK